MESTVKNPDIEKMKAPIDAIRKMKIVQNLILLALAFRIFSRLRSLIFSLIASISGSISASPALFSSSALFFFSLCGACSSDAAAPVLIAIVSVGADLPVSVVTVPVGAFFPVVIVTVSVGADLPDFIVTVSVGAFFPVDIATVSRVLTFSQHPSQSCPLP